jgi:hypothetical protein
MGALCHTRNARACCGGGRIVSMPLQTTHIPHPISAPRCPSLACFNTLSPASVVPPTRSTFHPDNRIAEWSAGSCDGEDDGREREDEPGGRDVQMPRLCFWKRGRRREDSRGEAAARGTWERVPIGIRSEELETRQIHLLALTTTIGTSKEATPSTSVISPGNGQCSCS